MDFNLIYSTGGAWHNIYKPTPQFKHLIVVLIIWTGLFKKMLRTFISTRFANRFCCAIQPANWWPMQHWLPRLHNCPISKWANWVQIYIFPPTLIPSIRLTHFAVGKQSHGQGLGSRFLLIIKDLLLEQWNELCAFRLLVVDARHEVRQFYEQNGFFECSATKAQKKHTIEMYYDLLGAD